MADQPPGPVHSPVHDSPDRSDEGGSAASSGAHSCRQLVSLSGFTHEMCNGTYTVSAAGDSRWPRFTNSDGMHLYYQAPTERWCLNVSLPSDANDLTCSARQVEAAAGLPAGEQQWIEACRTEEGGTDWFARRVAATLATGFAPNDPCQHHVVVHPQVAEVVSAMAEQLEAQQSQLIAAAKAGATCSEIWSDTAARHGDRDDLEHVLEAMVGTLERLHRDTDMVPSALENRTHVPADDFDTVEAEAIQENEHQNESVRRQVEQTLASVTDEEALLGLPVKLLVPSRGRTFWLHKLVPLEFEWIGNTCVRVFNGWPVAAVVVKKARLPTATGGVDLTGYTLRYTDGSTEDLVASDVRAALMLGQVIAVRQAQMAEGFPVGSVLQLHARVYCVREPDETAASIASSARCSAQELLQLNVSRFTHLAGKRLQCTSEDSHLDPGSLLLVPCTDSMMCIRVMEFVGWSAVCTQRGECCWPQWLVADVADPQLTMRCCPPPRSVATQHPSCSPSTAVGAQPSTKPAWLGRQTWAPEEDAHIRRAVDASEGQPDWPEIAKALNDRSSKQCRERYNNQLCPNIKRGPWSEEEERILKFYQKRLGNLPLLTCLH